MAQSKRARKRARQARRGGPGPSGVEAPPDGADESAEPERTAARPPSRIDRMLERTDQRPKPPWHPVPLVEIAVLAGIVLLILGFINYETDNGRLSIVIGIVLASAAGIDTAAREHFAGYRSHSSLLAGLPAVGTIALLALARLPLWLCLLGAAAVFAIVFTLARRAFRHRTGVSYKR